MTNIVTLMIAWNVLMAITISCIIYNLKKEDAGQTVNGCLMKFVSIIMSFVIASAGWFVIYESTSINGVGGTISQVASFTVAPIFFMFALVLLVVSVFFNTDVLSKFLRHCLKGIYDGNQQ